jgi:hypothetical protein
MMMAMYVAEFLNLRDNILVTFSSPIIAGEWDDVVVDHVFGEHVNGLVWMMIAIIISNAYIYVFHYQFVSLCLQNNCDKSCN